MTDKELVAKLREAAENACDNPGDEVPPRIVFEAADAIERLTRERSDALLRAETFERQYRQACEDHAQVMHALRTAERERDEARAKALEEAAREVEAVAAIIDHPSVYMGGASREAIRKAQSIAKAIRALATPPAT